MRLGGDGLRKEDIEALLLGPHGFRIQGLQGLLHGKKFKQNGLGSEISGLGFAATRTKISRRSRQPSRRLNPKAQARTRSWEFPKIRGYLILGSL